MTFPNSPDKLTNLLPIPISMEGMRDTAFK